MKLLILATLLGMAFALPVSVSRNILLTNGGLIRDGGWGNGGWNGGWGDGWNGNGGWSNDGWNNGWGDGWNGNGGWNNGGWNNGRPGGGWNGGYGRRVVVVNSGLGLGLK